MANQQTPAQQMIGDFARKLVELTDEVLFGDIWERPGTTLKTIIEQADESPKTSV
jgi:hypothetical protein